ncbi:myelin and lymphocyte protein-like [Aplochiton taeniatus]
MATTSVNPLPSGSQIFTSVPDVFFIPEFVFGGLVWILVASTHVQPENPLGWVMFVSLFCFILTTIWFLVFIAGGNQSSIWPSLDVAYHALAAFFYLSSSVALAYITCQIGLFNRNFPGGLFLKVYQEDIAAVVMSYVATLLYVLHAIFSAIRWKSS